MTIPVEVELIIIVIIGLIGGKGIFQNVGSSLQDGMQQVGDMVNTGASTLNSAFQQRVGQVCTVLLYCIFRL